MIDIAFNDRGAVQLDAIGADRAFNATTDGQFLRDDIAFDLRTIANLNDRAHRSRFQLGALVLARDASR